MRRLRVAIIIDENRGEYVTLNDNEKVVGFSSSFWDREEMSVSHILIEEEVPNDG